MEDDYLEYTTGVTISYQPALEMGSIIDENRWAEIEVAVEAGWSVGWLNQLVEKNVDDPGEPGGAPFLRNTNLSHTSWGADGAGITISLLIFNALFAWAAEKGIARVASAIAERLHEAPGPINTDLAIDRARQRVAIRHDTDGAALRLVELTEGTDAITVVLEEPNGSARYEVATRTYGPSVQTVRCTRTFS
jgi:hypothetical protein